MPKPLQIACLVHVHASSFAGAAELGELLEEVCWPLLRSISDGTSAPLNLHFSGTILGYARDTAPSFLAELRRCSREGRIEVVGGALFAPVLPSIPARDVVGQLQATSDFCEEHFGSRPKGVWQSLSAWDASVIAPLRDAGVEWALAPGSAWEVVGWDSWDVHGHFTTERHGRVLSLFPIDEVLASAVYSEGGVGLRDRLARVAGRPGAPALVSLALDGERLVRSGHHSELMSCLRSEHHWLKPRLFSGVQLSLPSRGAVYLSQSALPSLAPWCRSVGALDSDVGDGPVVWENCLARYPEANRLHKRMLRVSSGVRDLRKALASQQRKGKNIGPARKLLEKASTALWRAQGHDAYWHGGSSHLGIYDPLLRGAAVRHLLTAEKIVRRLLGGREPQPWSEEIRDFDGDGSDELMVRTGTLQAIIDAPTGGGLVELDLLGPGLGLLCGFDPIEEPYHRFCSGTEIQLVDSEGELVGPAGGEPGREAVPALDRVAVGRLRRGAFVDHFLGPETSIGSFSRGQYRELGDFAGGAYDVLAVQGEARAGEAAVGRSGVVGEGEERALLRIEKTYRFDLKNPALTLIHRMANLSRDPAAGWFGLEWSFGIPSGKPEGVLLKVQGPEGPATYRLEDGPVALPAASWFEWEDPAAGLTLVIELDSPHALWWMPVVTVAQGPAGWREDVQGNTLLFHSRADIWGDEERRFTLRAAFLSGE